MMMTFEISDGSQCIIKHKNMWKMERQPLKECWHQVWPLTTVTLFNYPNIFLGDLFFISMRFSKTNEDTKIILFSLWFGHNFCFI